MGLPQMRSWEGGPTSNVTEAELEGSLVIGGVEVYREFEQVVQQATVEGDAPRALGEYTIEAVRKTVVHARQSSGSYSSDSDRRPSQKDHARNQSRHRSCESHPEEVARLWKDDL